MRSYTTDLFHDNMFGHPGVDLWSIDSMGIGVTRRGKFDVICSLVRLDRIVKIPL